MVETNLSIRHIATRGIDVGTVGIPTTTTGKATACPVGSPPIREHSVRISDALRIIYASWALMTSGLTWLYGPYALVGAGLLPLLILFFVKVDKG
jgi:hypothetical protein